LGRLFALLLFLSLLTTSACVEHQTAAQAAHIPLEVWDGPRPSAGSNKFSWAEGVLAEYEARHPGVSVTLVRVPWQEMIERLEQRLASGNWPDVVPLYPGLGGIRQGHVEQGLVEAVDAFYPQAGFTDLYPAARKAFTRDGKMYGFPSSMSLHAMILNLEIFREARVEPPKDGRWTFSEFQDVARRLTFTRPATKQKVYGFAAYVQKGYYEIWPFLYMNGATPLSEDMSRFTLDSPQGESALQCLVDLKYRYGAAAPETGSSDHGGIWHAFASPLGRRVAMEPWADWAIMMAKEDPRFLTDIMVAHYPTGRSGNPVTIGSAYGYSVLKQPDNVRRKAAMDLAAALSSPEQQAHFAASFGLLPARRSVTETVAFPNAEIKRAALMLDEVILPPAHPQWVQIENSINGQVQTALIGEKTADQALKDARYEVEKLISLPK